MDAILLTRCCQIRSNLRSLLEEFWEKYCFIIYLYTGGGLTLWEFNRALDTFIVGALCTEDIDLFKKYHNEYICNLVSLVAEKSSHFESKENIHISTVSCTLPEREISPRFLCNTQLLTHEQEIEISQSLDKPSISATQDLKTYGVFGKEPSQSCLETGLLVDCHYIRCRFQDIAHINGVSIESLSVEIWNGLHSSIDSWTRSFDSPSPSQYFSNRSDINSLCTLK